VAGRLLSEARRLSACSAPACLTESQKTDLRPRFLPARGPAPLVPRQPNAGQMAVRRGLIGSERTESEEIRPAVGRNRGQKPHWRRAGYCWN